MTRAVIFDLDGVVRHFDATGIAGIERRCGLAPGSILDTALAEPLITEVTTGRITRAAWVERVGERLGSPEAAAAWSGQPARVDPVMLELSDELRRNGLTTAILTNGTDTIAAEVEQLGIAPHFDAIHNSAVIGYAKPDVRVFQYVLDDLGVSGGEAFFTDDSPSKLTGAAALGMTVHHFTGIDGLREALGRAGVRTG